MKRNRLFSLKPKPSLFVSVPAMRGMVTTECALSLVALTAASHHEHVPIEVRINPEPRPHAWERNDAAAQFLASSASHHLLIDDDIGFDASSVLAMLSSGHPLIGCGYPTREIPARIVARTFDDSGVFRIVDHPSSPPVRVSEIGTGCMLVAREVYEKIAPRVPTYERAPFVGEMRSEFFKFDLASKDGTLQELPEDHFFCRQARAAGFDVMLMTTLASVCTHTGRFKFDVTAAMRREEIKEAAE